VSTGNQQLLQRYAQPLFTSSATDDVNVPFSFKDWFAAHQGIIPGQEFKQYNEYLVRWYKDRSQSFTDFNLQLRLNYLTLLKQLQLFLTTEEAENWYSRVNLDDEKELLLAIPFFAKKLKDISLYYLQLRTSLKESRLRYNQTGTNTGVIEQIQKFLLNNYTKKPNSSISLPGLIWKDIPELSAVKDNIAIQIEELYDTQNYFDRSPTLPVSAYYTVNTQELANFLTTKGLNLSSTEWIYRLGVNALSADYTEIIGQDLIELSNKIAQKYLAQDKYTSLNSAPSTDNKFFNIDLVPGNNFFYWPEGVYNSRAKLQQRYKPVLINESGLNTVATAGSSIQLADTIFVKTPRGIEGAWFRKRLYDYKNDIMEAVLGFNSTTTFRFPYPGYGLSAQDIPWTGYSTKFNPTFFYLDRDLQQIVEREYWSTEIILSAVTPLLINDTTLIDSKAFANLDFNRADKIDVWFDTPNYDSTVYNGQSKSAWLYRFNKTDISVAPGLNTIVWPFEKISSAQDYPVYFPTNISDTCLPLPVSGLKINYSIAGDSLSSSDVIYKITNYQDPTTAATEGCWLSGKTITIPEQNAYITEQNSFQLLINSGEYIKFIWTGRNNINADTVFKTISHQPDCKYISLQDPTYLDFDQCNCKQVNYTPFGHPGEKFTDNRSFADFIVEDNFTPSNFDITTWKDLNNKNYSNSPSFAWYKTNSKIGWGDGQWHSGDTSIGNKFYLQTGKKYVYYRTKTRTQNTTDVTLPPYVVRYMDEDFNNNGVWLRALKNEDDEWIGTNELSQMVLNPGDTILYNRASTTNFYLTGTTTEIQYNVFNEGSIWSNFDRLTINDGTPEATFQNVVLSYPDFTTLTTSNTSQYPAVRSNQIVSILRWDIRHNETSTTYTFLNTPAVTFTPNLTGTYSTTLTAMTAQVVPPVTIYSTTTAIPLTGSSLRSFYYLNTGLYVFTRVPVITADSPLVSVNTLTGYNTPMPGFVINVPLQGWDYNLGIKSLYATFTNRGARPFWATTYTDKTSATGFKGVQSWGTPQRIIDGYNILTQPEISDITLSIGNKIQYTRNYPVDLDWKQPITFRILIDEDTWCTLNFETTSDSNLSYQLNNFKNNLVVTPTLCTSNLQFLTLVDNEPTEVYYNALTPFTWSITADPEIITTFFSETSTNVAIKANQPWGNLSNQFYPTFAAFPTIDKLYSTTQSGGYNIPSNLGISTYLNKDYTATFNTSSNALTGFFENIQQKFGGRGFTKQDQETPYHNITENNIWLKEPTVAGSIAGTVKKNIFKKYQKFYPYQSGYESNNRLQFGLLTPKSRQTPWGGTNDLEWTDYANLPQSKTGELNVQAWADSQILKQTNLQIDNWCTDIFGNQYALYKSLSSSNVYNKKFIPGEIWVRKNSQFTSPALISLNNVFDTYANTNLINELTGRGIRKIDMFFDTLLIETSGTIIFEKLNYDFANDLIFSLTDEARYISLTIPVSTNLNKEFANTNLSGFNFAQAGETWFFPEEKIVTQSVCGLQDTRIIPELYSLNLNNQNLRKIFPIKLEDTTLINELSTLSLVSITPPVLSYNTLRKEYLLTILGKNNNNKNVVIELTIKNLTVPYLENVVVYEPIPTGTLLEPPAITQDLIINVNITNIDFVNALNFQCNAVNTPAVFEGVDLPSWVFLNSTGRFTGTPPLQTTQYYAYFKVTNSVGTIFYNLQININYTEIFTIYYLYYEGYSVFNQPDEGPIVQEDHIDITNESLIIALEE
jgi:hypothetical protein